MLEYLSTNKEWIFSGIGILVLTLIGNIVFSVVRAKLDHKKPRLEIKYSFQQVFVQTALGNSPVYPVLHYEITNIGEVDVLIKSVSIDFCGKKITYLGFDESTGLTTESTSKVDKLIKPKEYYKESFEIVDLVKAIGNQLGIRDRIRVQVIDTLGHRYNSKKFRYKDLIQNVEIANGVNSGK